MLLVPSVQPKNKEVTIMTLLMKPEPFSQEVNRLFNNLFDLSESGAQRWVPAMDLMEADDHFVLKADLPGLAEDDVAIEIQDNTLTISGERRAEHEERERGWYRVERSFGRFSRSLSLPEGVDPDAVKAEFDNGVLEVRIPKPEERKPRRVAIKAASNGDAQPAVEGTATDK
jgi:HSP20 family protein